MPHGASMGDDVSNFVQNTTIAHRLQYFHGIRIWNCVLEFSPDWSTSAALQRDCCVGIRDAHPRLVPIVAGNQPITNADSSDNRPFPVIVREQEFTFNFYWHELLRLTTGKVLGARLGVELFLSRLFGLLSGRPPTNTRPPACEIDRPQRSGWRHHSQDI